MKIYFMQFLAYTMAMVGFLTVCVYTYRKFCIKSFSNSNNNKLCIENGIRINARKQILVIKVGNERFLIASDTDRTTMLAKLEDKKMIETELVKKINEMNEVEKQSSIKEKENNKPIYPAMKRILEKMKV